MASNSLVQLLRLNHFGRIPADGFGGPAEIAARPMLAQEHPPNIRKCRCAGDLSRSRSAEFPTAGNPDTRGVHARSCAIRTGTSFRIPLQCSEVDLRPTGRWFGYESSLVTGMHHEPQSGCRWRRTAGRL